MMSIMNKVPLILFIVLISSYFVGSINFLSSYQIGKSVPSSTTSDPVKEDQLRKERCFVAIKPDAVQRDLIGEVISRFEKKGLKLCAIKLVIPDSDIVKKQYASLQNASFFGDILDFFTSGPIVAMVWEGENIITVARRLIGKTHPEDAEPGSIRGDYCSGKGRNLVHTSDSADSASREINIWFRDDELVKYTKGIDKWVFPQSNRK